MQHKSSNSNKKDDADRITAIEPLFNSAFTRIFGREESKPATLGLVNAILKRAGIDPIESIEDIEAEHTANEGSVECKTPRMDVRIIATGRILDLEAQCYPEDIASRSTLYASQLLCENAPKGISYKDIPQVIVITLLDTKPLFPEQSDYITTCRMNWSNGQPGPDRILFIVLELEKIRKRYNRLDEEVLSDDLIAWLYVLTNGYAHRAEIEALMNEVPSIEYFAELYGRAIDDPKVKRAYEDAISAEREYQSRQDYYARIRNEGIEQGAVQGIGQMVEALRENGVDESTIQAALAIVADRNS